MLIQASAPTAPAFGICSDNLCVFDCAFVSLREEVMMAPLDRMVNKLMAKRARHHVAAF